MAQDIRDKIAKLLALADSPSEAEARAAGVTAFCSKPMSLSDLGETLMSALGQKLTDAPQELLPEKNADFKDKHILLVEDNELNREIAQEILREYGFRVDTAENGEVAVEKVSTAAPGSYDLVLMEGFKESGWPKIEVVRKAVSEEPVSFEPLAIVGDVPGADFALDEPAALADWIAAQMPAL